MLRDRKKLSVGLIVNPWAGIGGEVALKGSDGESIRKQALSLGAQLKSEKRVESFLKSLKEKETQLFFLTYPLSMGENVLKSCGFECEVLGSNRQSEWAFNKDLGQYECSALDTQEAAKKMAEAGVDIIVFAGGDGTARDVATALKTFSKQLCLGIPAGVKIQSGVYARSPESAAEMLSAMTEQIGVDVCVEEVRDIDEEALRLGKLESRYFSELRVPSLPEKGLAIQGSKQGKSQLSEGELADELLVYEEIAACLLERLESESHGSNVLLIVGAGKTTQVFKRALCHDGAFDPSLLGVDVFLNGHCLLLDASEDEILNLLNEHPEYLQQCKIVVSVIGGQGFIFGRGSQPISAKVIQQVLDAGGREGIVVLASQKKIMALQESALFVDTGDAELNQQLTGTCLVLVNYEQEMLCRVRA